MVDIETVDDVVYDRIGIVASPYVDIRLEQGSVLFVEVHGAVEVQESVPPVAIYPVVTWLEPDLAERALDFFGGNLTMLVDHMALVSDCGATPDARLVLRLSHDPLEVVETYVDRGFAEVPHDKVVSVDAWAVFLAVYKARNTPQHAEIPPYDSRVVHQHLLALRAMNPGERSPGMEEQRRILKGVLAETGSKDERLVAVEEDLSLALDGELYVYAGYSVVVPVYREMLRQEGAIRSWPSLGGLEVIVSFGLSPEEAAAVYVEVLKDPSRFVHADYRVDASKVREVIGVPRIVPDISLDWPLVDLNARRNFEAYDRLRQEIGARAVVPVRQMAQASEASR